MSDIIKNNIFLPLFLLAGLFATNTISADNIERVLHHVDNKQVACLAKNIYFEAGHESMEGKAAVARVVINRVHHGFGSTPCAVVYQSKTVMKNDEPVKVCQFSWVCENKTLPNVNNKEYQYSLQVAYEVLALDMYKEVIPRSVLFFHNLSVEINSSWPYKKVKQIGNHIFYSKQRDKNKQ